MEHPTEPKVSRATWQQLHQKLAEIKNIEPWELLTDSDLFGVKCPRTGELGFGCVMGNGGLCFGLVVYRGRLGYQNFVAIQNGLDTQDQVEVSHMQNGVFAEFTAREFMDPIDLKRFKDLGLKFRGKHAWPLLRSLRPGYVPWYIDEDEAQLLTSVLEVTPLVTQEVSEDLDFTHGENGDCLPLYSLKNGKWGYEWVGKWHFMEPDPDQPKTADIDEIAVARLAKRKLARKGIWETGCFLCPEPVSDGGRPYYPIACAVLDAKSGIALGVEIASNESDHGLFAQSMILATAEKCGHLPISVNSDDPRMIEKLKPLGKKLGFKLNLADFKYFSELLGHVNGSGWGNSSSASRPRNKSSAEPRYYELEISLNETDPRLWRRIQINADATFEDLHRAIQDACGWENNHLYEFRTPGRRGEEITSYDADLPPDKLHLSDYFDRKKKCRYIYDFGDGWDHDIKLCKIIKGSEKFKRRLIGGERAFPLEDCGGIPGYYHCVDVISGATNDEEMKEWLEGWDPDTFDLDQMQEKFDR